MKKVIFVFLSLLLVFTLCLSGISPALALEEVGSTYYFDSVDGDDGNSGLSQEEALQHFSMISELELSSGDKILLKCGQTFISPSIVSKASGTQEAPILLSSYGTGVKPLVKAEGGERVFSLAGASHWVIQNIRFTAPNGYGLEIASANGIGNCTDITVEDCEFTNIANERSKDRTSDAAVYIGADGAGARVSDIVLRRLYINNCPWGIHITGINREEQCRKYFQSVESSYNKNIVIEDCVIQNGKFAGIVIGATYQSIVRNCRVLNCATAQKKAYAPLWIRHSDHVTVSYCEIAGSTNSIDGMAVDFDGWTTNCTYEYIYSHDNVRFVKNCVYDFKTKNRGNAVKNCVSVNDNRSLNWSATALISFRRPSFSFMHDFTFKNNTIVNGKPILWLCTPGAEISNNTFIGNSGNLFWQKVFNYLGFANSDTYVSSSTGVQEQIDEITCRLPALSA